MAVFVRSAGVGTVSRADGVLPKGRIVKYPDDMDEELVPLCDALNKIPGLRTRFCCCGHGRDQFYVTAMAKTIEAARAFNKVFRMRGAWVDVELLDYRNQFVRKGEIGIIAESIEIGMYDESRRRDVYAKLTRRAERIARHG